MLKLFFISKEALDIIYKHSLLKYLLAIALITTLLSMPTRALLAPYSSEILSGGPLEVGLMLAAIGTGALIGTLTAASLPQKTKKGKYILITSVISGLSILLLNFLHF